jgi:hypothetical protein
MTSGARIIFALNENRVVRRISVHSGPFCSLVLVGPEPIVPGNAVGQTPGAKRQSDRHALLAKYGPGAAGSDRSAAASTLTMKLVLRIAG